MTLKHVIWGKITNLIGLTRLTLYGGLIVFRFDGLIMMTYLSSTYQLLTLAQNCICFGSETGVRAEPLLFDSDIHHLLVITSMPYPQIEH